MLRLRHLGLLAREAGESISSGDSADRTETHSAEEPAEANLAPSEATEEPRRDAGSLWGQACRERWQAVFRAADRAASGLPGQLEDRECVFRVSKVRRESGSYCAGSVQVVA